MKSRRKGLRDNAAVNWHWMHRPPETWDLSGYDTSKDGALLDLVDQEVRVASGERLVDVIGADSFAVEKGCIDM